MICDEQLQPCQTGDCDGLAEVAALLPAGALWNPNRDGVYGSFVRALGHIKTDINRRICQEFGENDPCTAVRRFAYFAEKLKLPACVDQTSDNMCAWLALITDRGCPPGTQGFMRRAVEFVAPSAGITLTFNPVCGDTTDWQLSGVSPEYAQIVVSAPASAYHVALDSGGCGGVDPDSCSEYFIPAIECLRDCVFPFGVSMCYTTDPMGPNGEPIWGVESATVSENNRRVMRCCSNDGLLGDCNG